MAMDFAKQGSAAKEFFLAHANWFAPLFLVLAFFFSLMVIGGSIDRTDQLFKRYDAYWNAAQKDFSELDALYSQYAYAPPYSGLADRAAAAQAYALRAKEAFAEWNSFKSFVNGNDAALKNYGTDTTRFVSLMDTAGAGAVSNAQTVSSELKKLAGTDSGKNAEVAGAVRDLDALSGGVKTA
ncbi:MAG: hypothetical protein NTY90_05835 [Candidatus Micrarchaeota archaeon]|nr:hypothetical protein [Candidatus Micrarchaeota archaeon]